MSPLYPPFCPSVPDLGRSSYQHLGSPSHPPLSSAFPAFPLPPFRILPLPTESLMHLPRMYWHDLGRGRSQAPENMVNKTGRRSCPKELTCQWRETDSEKRSGQCRLC